MQINKNPKLMLTLLIVAMVLGSLLSIVVPTLWALLRRPMILGSYEPPANADFDQTTEFYKNLLQKAIDTKMPPDVLTRAAANYGDWLNYNVRDEVEAKRIYAQAIEFANRKDADTHARILAADCMIHSGYAQHRLYIQNKGNPPEVQTALKAQKIQIESAKKQGYTDDVNDVQRQLTTVGALSTFSCDNRNFADGLKYADEVIALEKKNTRSPSRTAANMVKKARALSGLGRTEEADKMFTDAVKICDTEYGAGSSASERRLHEYSDPLIRDGRVEFGKKIKQQQDDLSVW